MTIALGKLRSLFKNKTFRIVAVLLGALLLLLLIWKVFFKTEKAGTKETEREARLAELLGRIEGVKDATVMIAEEEGNAVGAVVVFSGEDGFLTRMRLAKVAASALNVRENAIVVYPAK